MLRSVYIVLLLSFFGIECKSQHSIEKALLAEVKKKSIEVSYLKKIENELEIIYPNTGINYFDSLILKYISIDLAENYCDNDGKVEVKYEVKSLTKKMISIVRKTDIMSCPHYAELHTEMPINFLFYENRLFEFGLSKKAIINLNHSLKADLECQYDKESVTYGLYIQNAEFYVQVWQDKVCNYVQKVKFDAELIDIL